MKDVNDTTDGEQKQTEILQEILEKLIKRHEYMNEHFTESIR